MPKFIADRIGEVARTLGLDAGAPGCSPNIFILATGDPAALIKGLRLKRQGLVTGPDSAVIARIQRSHDAVRWIGATTMTGPSRVSAQDSGFNSADHAVPQMNVYGGGSRLSAGTQTFLTRETIIVDAGQIEGLGYDRLADYLTVVALAQINPHAAAPDVDSILSLFPRGNRAPAGLTAFDRAYLAALYRIDPNSPGMMQKGQIESLINGAFRSRDRQATAPDPAPPGH